jgi:hypothetical protein
MVITDEGFANARFGNLVSQTNHLIKLCISQKADGFSRSNGMISELIANAAKAKSAQTAGGGGVFRRVSVRRPQSTSGNVTPRVASPATR